MSASRQLTTTVWKSLLVPAVLAVAFVSGQVPTGVTPEAPAPVAGCPLDTHWTTELQACVDDTHW